VTEGQWLTSDDPRAMLRCVTDGPDGVFSWPWGPVSSRKLRAFCCACCLMRGSSVYAVDGYEKSGAPREFGEARFPDRRWAEEWARRSVVKPTQRQKADALRDIIGNPFRPVTLPLGPICEGCDGQGGWASSAGKRGGVGGQMITPCGRCDGEGYAPCPWITPDVLAIAAKVYADRDWQACQILADAMEESGCDSPDLLAHLRSAEVHVRGCWAIDCIRGAT
jgi:hypothetical protein